MAITTTNYAPTQSKWGISEESAFGTGVTDSSAAFEMCEGPIPSVDMGVTRDRSVKFNGSRVPYSANQYSTTTGGVRVISFSDVIMRRTDLCNYQVAVMQTVAETSGSPYGKSSAWTSTTTQPTFVTTNGKYYSIGIFDPITAYHRQFVSCILRTLTLKPGGDGRLVASGEWISGFAPVTTATFGGAWAYGTQNYYNARALTIKQIADADIVVYDWSITLNNHAVVGSWSGTGYAENYVLGSGPEGYEVLVNLVVKYDANVQGLLADDIAGTARKIELTVGPTGATGGVDFLIYGAIPEGVDKDYGKPEGQAITLPFRGVYDGSNGMILMTTSDNVDQTWVDF